MNRKIIVLGTGGTIAGTAANASDHTGYDAAQIGIAALLEAVPGLPLALQGNELECEQIAQLDSKDMDIDTMLLLAQQCERHLKQPDVIGLVITHGTDTLEESAYFLHCMIPPELQTKPIVLTCAMRPATSSEADGPRNVCDALRVAGDAQAQGVVVVCAGDVHHAALVQKIHSYALNAFSSGDEALGELGRLAQVLDSRVKWCANSAAIYQQNQWIAGANQVKYATELIASADIQKMGWPRVEIVMNHAQASGGHVRALLKASTPEDPLRAIVVAGTGNGTVSHALLAALLDARSQGIDVVMSSRCAWGGVRGVTKADFSQTRLPAVKARIAWLCAKIKAV